MGLNICYWSQALKVCKFCASTNVVKNGISKGLQRYLCKICRHKFYDNGNSFIKMRTPSHIVITALNLYFSGLSVRKVSEQISQIYGQQISQVTMWSWIQKYSMIVYEYVNNLRPNLSGKYHHDETEIKVGGDGRYFWETIDEDTRFVVAHLLSENRTSAEAKKVFKQALDKQRPNAFFTDGSFAYDDAFDKIFYSNLKTKKVEWVRKVGIKARETNNIVERLHGTFKDRYNPMRGLKKDNTAQRLLNGYITHYNFCRKHQSLGTTPAQAAGLQVNGGWKELIEKAQIERTHNQSDIEIAEVKILR